MPWHGWVCTNNNSYGFISPWKKNAKKEKCIYFNNDSFETNSHMTVQNLGIGTCVSFSITSRKSGEKNLQARNLYVLTPFVIPSTQIGLACQRYLSHFIKENGACKIEDLVQQMSLLKDNPKVLRNLQHDALKAFVLCSELEHFCVRNGVVCDYPLETDAIALLKTGCEKYDNKMEFQKINGVFSQFATDELRTYLFGKNGWVNGIKSFIARNSKLFCFWNHTIYYLNVFKKSSEFKKFQYDLKAVQYFSKFVQAKGPMKLRNLAGHYAQAPAKIKEAVKSSSWNVFAEFINRNCFFFKMQKGCTHSKTSLNHEELISEVGRNDFIYEFDVEQGNLDAIEIWIANPANKKQPKNEESELVDFYINILKKSGLISIQKLTGYYSQSTLARNILSNGKVSTLKEFFSKYPQKFQVNCDDTVGEIENNYLSTLLQRKSTPEFKGKQKKSQPAAKSNKKAFTDLSSEANNIKYPVACTDTYVRDDHGFELKVSSHQEACINTISPGNPGRNLPQLSKVEIFPACEEESLLDLLDRHTFQEFCKKLSERGLSSHQVLFLRLTLGRKPTIKIFQDTSEMPLLELNNCNATVAQQLAKLATSNHLCNIGKKKDHYGIKYTLHSVRLTRNRGEISSAAIIFQEHSTSFIDRMEVIQRRRLTAIISNDQDIPVKYAYNFLRSKSAEMSEKLHDVSVIDVNGKLGGFEKMPHSSLGHVTWVHCSNEEEIPTSIRDAVENMHDCIICPSVDTTEVLNEILYACRKGKKVVAEVSIELREELLKMFPE